VRDGNGGDKRRRGASRAPPPQKGEIKPHENPAGQR
jgi:hypothetical protein